MRRCYLTCKFGIYFFVVRQMDNEDYDSLDIYGYTANKMEALAFCWEKT